MAPIIFVEQKEVPSRSFYYGYRAHQAPPCTRAPPPLPPPLVPRPPQEWIDYMRSNLTDELLGAAPGGHDNPNVSALVKARRIGAPLSRIPPGSSWRHALCRHQALNQPPFSPPRTHDGRRITSTRALWISRWLPTSASWCTLSSRPTSRPTPWACGTLSCRSRRRAFATCSAALLSRHAVWHCTPFAHDSLLQAARWWLGAHHLHRARQPRCPRTCLGLCPRVAN